MANLLIKFISSNPTAEIIKKALEKDLKKKLI